MLDYFCLCRWWKLFSHNAMHKGNDLRPAGRSWIQLRMVVKQLQKYKLLNFWNTILLYLWSGGTYYFLLVYNGKVCWFRLHELQKLFTIVMTQLVCSVELGHDFGKELPFKLHEDGTLCFNVYLILSLFQCEQTMNQVIPLISGCQWNQLVVFVCPIVVKLPLHGKKG